MSAIGSLSTAVSTLRANPIILLAGLAFVLVSEVVVLFELVNPLLPLLGYPLMILVYPFVLAGMIGLIDRSLDGRVSMDDFVDSGRSNYLSMLGASLLLAAIIVVVTVAITVVAVVVGAVAGGALLAGGGDDLGTGVLLVISLVVLFAAGLLFLVYMFLQFFDTAIVVSGNDAVESISTSVGLVRRNLLSVVGYTILFGLVSFVPRIPDTVAYMLGSTPELIDEVGFDIGLTSQQLLGLSIGLSLVFGTIALSLAYTYHVAYFRSIRESHPSTRAAVGAAD